MSTKHELIQSIALLRAEYDDMKPIEGQRLEMWWEALRGFPDGTVLNSVTRHLKTSHFKPQLADIVKGCEAQTSGSWLGADEAWALMPKSEYDSAILTDEIAQAIAAATPLLEQGDKIAARMAFKDAYTRLVEQARIEGRQPRYFPSFGTDPHARVVMLARAVQTGQVSADKAIGWQPEHATDIVRMAGITSHPLLAPPSDKGRAAVKALLSNLKAIK
jgi:hypothetical protein